MITSNPDRWSRNRRHLGRSLRCTPGDYVKGQWKAATITATAVGLIHGVIFWVVRKRCQKREAEAKAQLQAQKERLEQRMIEQTGQVRALTLAEQRERQAISYVLHDDLQQQLYGIQMQAHFLMADAASQDSEALRKQIEAMHDMLMLGEAVRKTRTLAVELNPPVLPGAGLDEALAWLAHQMHEEYNLDVRIETEASVRASEEIRVLLVQTVRELLFSVAEHAGVDQAIVRLSSVAPGLVQINVEDHGTGFDVATFEGQPALRDGAFGLYSVRERLRLLGGQLSIDSRLGGGTRVTLQAPLRVDEPADRFDYDASDVQANT